MALKFTDISRVLFTFIYLSFNTFGKGYPDETVLYYQVPLAFREAKFKVPSLKFKIRTSLEFCCLYNTAILFLQKNDWSQILLCSHLRLSRLVKRFQYTCIFGIVVEFIVFGSKNSHSWGTGNEGIDIQTREQLQENGIKQY